MIAICHVSIYRRHLDWIVRTIVVKPEKDCQQYGEGYGEENVRDWNIPQIHKPLPTRSRLKGRAGG